MAGTERTMGRIVGEEFEEVMARRMCMRETEGGIHFIQGLIGHKVLAGTLAFTLSESGNQ